MLAALIFAAALGQPVTTPSAIPAEPVICRNLQGAGTRLTARVCMTSGEWIAHRAELDEQRARSRPTIDNRRPGRGIGRW